MGDGDEMKKLFVCSDDYSFERVYCGSISAGLADDDIECQIYVIVQKIVRQAVK
jgi:hypothetical protein